MSNWLISLLSLVFLTKILLEYIFSTGVNLMSDTECPGPWKCLPTGFLVPWWQSWTTVFLCSEHLFSPVCPVSPTYWFWGQFREPFSQVTMYSRLELWQVRFPLIGMFSTRLLTITDFCSCPGWRPVNRHILQPDLPHLLNPSLVSLILALADYFTLPPIFSVRKNTPSWKGLILLVTIRCIIIISVDF